MKNKTQQFYNYHKWANQRVFGHIKELPDEVYDQEIKSVFSSIQEVIIHMYQVDGMWLSVMSGDSMSKTMKIINQLQEKSAGRNLEEMARLFDELYVKYQEFINGYDDLDKDITIEHPSYGKMESPVSDLVNHVVNHGTYHRGNITAMLRQEGHAGIPTDYIFYLYESK